MLIDKKSAAQELYNCGWEQKRIASIIGVAEQTVTGWKQKYRWEEKRAHKNMSREVAEQTVWKLINYQLEVLNAQVEDFKESKKLEPLSNGHLDGLYKLWATVKQKQLDWAVLVGLISEFTGFISERDLALSKQILDHADDFINLKRKQG